MILFFTPSSMWAFSMKVPLTTKPFLCWQTPVPVVCKRKFQFNNSYCFFIKCNYLSIFQQSFGVCVVSLSIIIAEKVDEDHHIGHKEVSQRPWYLAVHHDDESQVEQHNSKLSLKNNNSFIKP